MGLALTGPLAERVRSVVSPLRDLFAAAFFLAIGFSIPPASLPPLLPVAFGLAVLTALTKIGTGWFAAARSGSGRRGRLRAGSVLVVRGEFSVIIVGLVAAQGGVLGPLATGYVLNLAVAGPLLTWWLGRPDATLT